MIIRIAEFADTKLIAQLHITSWKETYRNIISEEVLNSITLDSRVNLWNNIISERDQMLSNKQVYVAVDDSSEIIGFISGGEAFNEPKIYDCEVYAFYILKEYQRKGIGQKLLKELINYFTKENYHSMIVWVLEENRFKSFYTKNCAIMKESKIDEDGYPNIGYVWDDISKIVS